MDQELLEAARVHGDAINIIANALQEMAKPTVEREVIEASAAAILARLAHANLVLKRFDPKDESVAELESNPIVGMDAEAIEYLNKLVGDFRHRVSKVSFEQAKWLNRRSIGKFDVYMAALVVTEVHPNFVPLD